MIVFPWLIFKYKFSYILILPFTIDILFSHNKHNIYIYNLIFTNIFIFKFFIVLIYNQLSDITYKSNIINILNSFLLYKFINGIIVDKRELGWK